MGYKHLPFAPPNYCWSTPGHIFVEEFDGTISSYGSTIKVAAPKQCNDFVSDTAKWALRCGESIFIGNKFDTYQEIRERDGVLLSCGAWTEVPRKAYEPCGLFGDMDCYISLEDNRTIFIPEMDRVFLLNKKAFVFDMFTAQQCAEESTGEKPVIITERGLVNFETDGTWVPSPHRKSPATVLRV